MVISPARRGFRSPDDYRSASVQRQAPSPGYGHNSGARPQGPIVAFDTFSLTDPALVDFMRGRATVTGVGVSDRVALRNSTFFRAMNLTCGSMGMLPIHLHERLADGTTRRAKDHPLYKVLHRRPNQFQSASEFKSYMQLCAFLDGNAYALIVKSMGRVTDLIPLPRRSVKPKLSDSFKLTFEYQRKNGTPVTLQTDQVFHFRAPISLDGLNGVSLLDIAADTLGLALVAQRAAGKLLTKGNMAGGALETDMELGDEVIARLKESLAENHAGAENAGEWMVLEEGLKAKIFAGSAKDAQLVESRKHEAEEISRFTDVPRPLLMFDETAWGTGIEQLGLFFVTYCLMKWFVIWEEAIWLCLLTEREQETFYAKYNEGALLRGSLKDQAEFFAKALGSGGGLPWMKQNEVRDNFELNPAEGGDALPRQGTTAADIAKEEQTDAA